MGSVHLAEHVGLHTQVAVKFLHIELSGQEEAVRRFEQEARVAASIRHPNIIQVFDVGFSEGGDPFLVMEYLEGESLATLLKRAGPLDLAATCGVMEPALLALQAAHRKGIIHRDLKPENVFLVHQPDQPPTVKLIDFGLSKITTGVVDQLRTQTGSVMGTPAYMSPEQARGATNLDHRTDLYSLGTILFEMLTGGSPYSGANFNEFFANLLTEEPRGPRDVYPAFPVEAEPMVRKAIRKHPDERFQSATEMLEALANLPQFEDRTKRLIQIGAGMSKSSFAGGDLGQGVWRSFSARSSGASQAFSATELKQPASAPEVDEPPRRSRRAWMVVAVVAAGLLVAGLALGLRKGPSPTSTAGVSAGAAVAPAEPAPAAGPQPARAEEPPKPAQPPAAEEVKPPEAKVEAKPSDEPAATKVASSPARARHRAHAGARASARGKKTSSGSSRLHRGARGTEMSDQFE
jgi:serine/threonine-protein kinase